MNNIEQIESDLMWISLMINFTEKSLMALEELKTIDQSSISSFSYLLMQDGLASTMAHIGEQLDSNKLSAEVQKEFDEVPWAAIRSYRNRHNHWYQDISHDTVATIVEEDLPLLLEQLIEIEKILRDRLSEY
jgi:hypothetical protein